MDETEAAGMLAELAAHRDPLTGEPLDIELLSRPAVVRALALAAQALKASAAAAEKRSRLPPNVGKAWTDAEDAQLLEAFDAGVALPELAMAHGRTVTGVRARLERHGRLAPTPDGGRRRYGSGRS